MNTRGTITDYDKCVANYTKCDGIGDPCEINKFCPTKVGELNLESFACPKGTESQPMSYSIDQCITDKSAQNVDYLKEMQNERRDYWT